MTCEECFYWDNSAQSSAATPDTTGLCRRCAPHVDPHFASVHDGFWPFTEDVDWCGEFRARSERSKQ